MPRIEFDPWAEERLDEEHDADARSSEEFDRFAFASRALALVRPVKTTVAISVSPDGGRRRVKVSSGRQWTGDPAERWAILSIPRDASRRAIAHAVLDLAGAARPWALDVLLAASGDSERR